MKDGIFVYCNSENFSWSPYYTMILGPALLISYYLVNYLSKVGFHCCFLPRPLSSALSSGYCINMARDWLTMKHKNR